MAAPLRYSEFASRIDVEEWCEAIGFERKYTKNGKNGEEWVGQCLNPWGSHKNGDSTGKLAVNPETRLFNCWVCGGGTLLSYSMAVKDMGEQDAIDWLYQFTRVFDQTNDEYLSDIDKILFEERQATPALPYFNENVLLKWREGRPQEFIDYLDERGISWGTSEDYRIGYDPKRTRRSSRGDHVGPAIIFPHFWGGRLVGWQERWLGDRPKHIPKYTNTHDFPRESTLFGYERVYFSEQPIVVVESVPTVLFLASCQIPAVATFGSNVADEQMRLLRRCQQGVIVAPDNDDPGRKFGRQLVRGLERYVKVRMCEPVPGEGADLGDLGEHPDGHDIARYLVTHAEFA